ncbi:hypothetical protein LXL04_027736 [Taraxacum kok-saghyz]
MALNSDRRVVVCDFASCKRGLICLYIACMEYFATRIVARELDLETTPVSTVMRRNPVFVISDTLAVEALQKMVQGKFRHLPAVENGEVIAILDIAKCLYDAIPRMERAAEKGKAIAAAVEGVENHCGTSASGSNTFIETLRERLFKPTLSTIISYNSKLVTSDDLFNRSHDLFNRYNFIAQCF